MQDRIAILGGGNIGQALARGFVASGRYQADAITLTRRSPEPLAELAADGFRTGTDNAGAVRESGLVILAVRPEHAAALLDEIRPALVPGHVLISVVTGMSVAELERLAGPEVAVVRAMPNTAVAVRESMTCLAVGAQGAAALDQTRALFDCVGTTMLIDERHMVHATALCACGVAFFLRAIRAASQGGIEIGFHADEALRMAAQVARGAATLLLDGDGHPEAEIDKVTTPRGCTIAGLNRMEHEGFSSALIKGIVTSSEKAATLY